jgi:succinate dehydrogenase/fumarate reductase flavoprotein subunit
LAAGGCVNIFRPRSGGEGQARAWYLVWNAGSTYAMAAEAGAELTMMENRFVATRFKDGYGPVGAWFRLFKAKATNALGEDFMERNRALLDDYPPYGRAVVPPSCLRNHLMLKEMKEGRAPIWIDTVNALAELREFLSPREVKYLEAKAWEEFLDMCIGQCGVWAGENIEPEKRNSELNPTCSVLMPVVAASGPPVLRMLARLPMRRKAVFLSICRRVGMGAIGVCPRCRDCLRRVMVLVHRAINTHPVLMPKAVWLPRRWSNM